MTHTAMIDNLLQQMTLEEKVGQLLALTAENMDVAHQWLADEHIGNFLNALSHDAVSLQDAATKTRLGIPLLLGIDAIHGHAFYQGATVFPTQISMASTWNPELVKQIGDITAKEAVATGVRWNYSPMLDVARDLRWGRIDETFGEDPHLVGEMGAAFVESYEANGFAACAKHFMGYSETRGGRDSSEGDTTKRKLKEVFLPPFQRAIEAGCQSIMIGYHAIDGIPCTANSWLLQDLLRDELKFEGVIVTDYDNVRRMHDEQMVCASIREAVKRAYESGLDIMMASQSHANILVELVYSGELDIEIINASCRRVLQLKANLGLFESTKIDLSPQALEFIGTQHHREIALDAAHEGTVLLTNKHNTLPLNPNIKKLAVFGANANDPISQLGDWVLGTWEIHTETQNPENIVTVLQGLQNQFINTEIRYLQGSGIHAEQVEDEAAITNLANWADAVIAVIGDDNAQNGEAKDRANLDLSTGQQQLIDIITAQDTPLIVVLINGKPLSIPKLVTQADAILEAWNPGCEGGTAVAQIISGDRAPTGKLPISFPHHVGQLPVYYNEILGWHGDPPKYIDYPPEALFPFGHGLTYTTFEYSNLRVTPNKTSVTLEVDLQNTGSREGTEVVQVYFNDIYTSLTTPAQQLIAFQRINIEPQTKKTLIFEIEFSSLTFINENGEQVFENGDFEFMVGGTSRQQHLLKKTITLSIHI